MAVVSLKIGGRFYKFSCNDGQEAHMRELADGLDKKAEQLLKSIGFMQEGQLLAMICLLLAEEKAQLQKSVENTSGVPTEMQEELVRAITNLALKIDVLADNLEQK
ncbi:MAG: cell division protein ZapA [Alphaproteobacteria bacterium]|nr:cell division protein ZapA [Alphaproteobacteria bacterium]